MLLNHLYVVAVAGMLIGAGVCARAEDTDLQTIKQRLYDEYLSAEADPASVNGYVDSLRADGSWPDIDYADDALTGWEPRTHLARTA
jgi:hypothetical protein